MEQGDLPVCRTCLSTEASKDISNLKSRKLDKNCSEIMFFCLSIQVQEDSKVSTKLCTKCLNKIKKFYTFKKLALESDAHLKSLEPAILKCEINIDYGTKNKELLNFGRPEIEIDLNLEIKPVSFKHEKEETEITVQMVAESSEDELLSDVKNIKYEFIPETIETIENGNEKEVSMKVEIKPEKTVHVCPECGKHVKNLYEHLQRHKLRNNPSLRLICKLCGRTFSSPGSLCKHKRLVHVQKKKACPFCDKAVKNLKSHILYNHQKSGSRPECHHCGKLFMTVSTYNLHLSNRPKSCYESEAQKNDQKPEPKLKLICPECGKHVVNLEEHILRHERRRDPSKRLPCSKCDKTFSCDSSRHYHIKNEHLGKVKSETCPFCNKAFKDLKSHISMKHQQSELPHECHHCGRRFLSKSMCEKHMTVHSDARPHACDVCDKAFRHISVLKQHKRDTHQNQKVFMCHHCSRSYSTANSLKYHLRTHSKDNWRECEKCGKSFASAGTLKNHMLTHSTERAFACKLCDKKFKCNRYLANHMLTHTREKRWQCKYCDMKFHRSDHQRQHEIAVHKTKELLPIYF